MKLWEIMSVNLLIPHSIVVVISPFACDDDDDDNSV